MFILNKLDFWELYMLMEASWEKSTYNVHLEELKALFPFIEETFSYVSDYDGETETYTESHIEFEFNCGSTYSLSLDYMLRYSIEWAESACKLFLKNKITQQKYLMGWRDMAQWHPLCIKPDEFDLMLNYWQSYDEKWKDSPYPQLLLRNYIGFSNKTEVEQFRQTIHLDIEQLGCQIPENLKEKILFVPFYADENYQWEKHQDLGWVYESKVYNCYSIRNECHSKTPDELFPFKEYQTMIDSMSEL